MRPHQDAEPGVQVPRRDNHGGAIRRVGQCHHQVRGAAHARLLQDRLAGGVPEDRGLALPFQIGNRVHVQLDHDRRESRIAEQAVHRAAHRAVPDDHGEAIPRRDSPADLLRRVRVGLAPAAPRGR